MTTVSISQIKINPSKVIAEAQDFPIAVENRNKIKAYLLGKDLYEKLITYIENFIDEKAIKESTNKKGVDFEKVASELGI